MSESEPPVTIEFRADLLDRIKSRLTRTEFDTSKAYVEYVLEEVLHHVEETDEEPNEEVDEEAIKDQLRALGYTEE